MIIILAYAMMFFTNRFRQERTSFFASILPILYFYNLIPGTRFPLFSWGQTAERRRDDSFFELLRSGKTAPLATVLKTAPVDSLNARVADGETPLTFLVSFRPQRELLSLLLEHGADPNLPNALGNYPILSAIISGRLALVELLLRYGARLDIPTPRQTSLLHVAAGFGRTAIVELLLQRGPAVNAINETGETPLHYAARRGSGAVTQLLLAHGANPRIRNNDGDSPLDIANKHAAGLVGLLLIRAGRVQVAGMLRRALMSH
jgi:ankyrin repeat protein